MGKVTNKYNYPECVVRSLIPKHGYIPNPLRIGVKDLMGAPLPRTLKLRHADDIETDVSSLINIFHGYLVDESIKRFAGMWDLTDIKLEIPTEYGLTLIGKPDIVSIDTGILTDIKYTSIWSFIFGAQVDDWEKQLNVYDWALNTTEQIHIKELNITAIFRDWKKTEAYKADYPDTPIKIVPIVRWPIQKQEDYINSRLEDHVNNPERECTPEEKWQTPDTFAVMKKGNKKASRVFENRNEADTYIKDKGDDFSVIKRNGECKKCNEYCSVNQFCKFYKGKKS